MFGYRNVLRGKVEQADNRNAAMGVIFLKITGDKYDSRRESIYREDGDNPVFWTSHHFSCKERVYS